MCVEWSDCRRDKRRKDHLSNQSVPDPSRPISKKRIPDLLDVGIGHTCAAAGDRLLYDNIEYVLHAAPYCWEWVGRRSDHGMVGAACVAAAAAAVQRFPTASDPEMTPRNHESHSSAFDDSVVPSGVASGSAPVQASPHPPLRCPLPQHHSAALLPFEGGDRRKKS